jgi:hypothetical protein
MVVLYEYITLHVVLDDDRNRPLRFTLTSIAPTHAAVASVVKSSIQISTSLNKCHSPIFPPSLRFTQNIRTIHSKLPYVLNKTSLCSNENVRMF